MGATTRSFVSRMVRGVVEHHGILCGQIRRAGQPGDHPETGPPGVRLDGAHPVIEQRGVTPKLVDHEAPDRRRIPRRQHSLCTGQAGDHAALVDVADQAHGNFDPPCESHVGDVAGPQVDFGGAAGPFHDDQFVCICQSLEKLESTASMREPRRAM